MIEKLSQAQEGIADAIWFIKGLLSQRKNQNDESSGDLRHLEKVLREARIFMGRVTDGSQRYIGDDTRGSLIVMTLPELERITDYLYENGAKEAPGVVTNFPAAALFNDLRAILLRAAEEEDRSNPDLPF